MAKSALIEELEKQFNENPRRVFARLANEYRKSGELELAIDICRTHIPQQPSYISGYIVLGQALFETQQFDDAKSTFETALGLDPENLIALRQLGDIARVLGDSDTARAWYQRLLEVDPQNEEAASQLQMLPPPAPPSTPREAPSSELDEFGWREINPAVAESAAPAAVPAAAPLPELSTLTDWMQSEPAPGTMETDAVAEHEPVDLDATLEVPVAMPVAGASAESPPSELPLLDTDFDGPEPLAVAPPGEIDLEPAPGVARPAEASEDHDEPVDASFVTETMAELYERQGFRAEALRIYRQLAEQRPDDLTLRGKVAALEGSAAAPGEPRLTIRQFFSRIARLPAPAPPDQAAAGATTPPPAAMPPADEVTPVEPMDAVRSEASRPWEVVTPPSTTAVTDEAPAEEPMASRSPTPDAASDAIVDVTALFPDAPVAAADDDAARVLSSAFPDGLLPDADGAQGEPARPAPDELSLDDVFRELSGGARVSRPNGTVSFDEFFSSSEGNDAPASDNGAPHGEQKGADLESFHAWLEGLKK